MKLKLSNNMFKLLFSVLFIVPFAVVVMLWNWLSPVGFFQCIVMIIVGIFLYCLMIGIGFTIILWLSE